MGAEQQPVGVSYPQIAGTTLNVPYQPAQAPPGAAGPSSMPPLPEKPIKPDVAVSMAPMGVAQGTPVTMPPPPGPPGKEPCVCSAGWVLFGVGFILPLCWIIGLFVPCCTKNVNDKRAAIGSAIAFVISVGISISLGVTQTHPIDIYGNE